MQQKFVINRQYLNKAFDERIRFLILHFTAKDFKSSLQLLQDKVSSHYLISDEPVIIHQLVDENKRAWHAGESHWKGRNNINDTSIGIEIVNLDGNKNAFLEEQIEATISLCKEIISRYNISPINVLGHSDIAPLRKDDPGILFPWNKLYQNGIGAMPNSDDVDFFEKEFIPPAAIELQKNLEKYGYKIDLTGNFDEQTKKVLDAFRRHFCPDLIGKEIDSRTYSTLQSLIKKYLGTVK